MSKKQKMPKLNEEVQVELLSEWTCNGSEHDG